MDTIKFDGYVPSFLAETTGSLQGRRVESDTSHRIITLTFTATRTFNLIKLSPVKMPACTMSSVTAFFQNTGTTKGTSDFTSHSYCEFIRIALELMIPREHTCAVKIPPSLQIFRPDET